MLEPPARQVPSELTGEAVDRARVEQADDTGQGHARCGARGNRLVWRGRALLALQPRGQPGGGQAPGQMPGTESETGCGPQRTGRGGRGQAQRVLQVGGQAAGQRVRGQQRLGRRVRRQAREAAQYVQVTQLRLMHRREVPREAHCPNRVSVSAGCPPPPDAHA